MSVKEITEIVKSWNLIEETMLNVSNKSEALKSPPSTQMHETYKSHVAFDMHVQHQIINHDRRFCTLYFVLLCLQ